MTEPRKRIIRVQPGGGEPLIDVWHTFEDDEKDYPSLPETPTEPRLDEQKRGSPENDENT